MHPLTEIFRSGESTSLWAKENENNRHYPNRRRRESVDHNPESTRLSVTDVAVLRIILNLRTEISNQCKVQRLAVHFSDVSSILKVTYYCNQLIWKGINFCEKQTVTQQTQQAKLPTPLERQNEEISNLSLKRVPEIKPSLTKTVQASFLSIPRQTGKKKITVMEIRLTNFVAIFVKPTLDENAKL